MKARTSEGFNKTYGIVHPLEQWASNRDVRLSPYHEREKALGAVFFEAAGWERPQWYESNAGAARGVRRSRRDGARPSGTRAGGRRSSTPSTWRCATGRASSTSRRSRSSTSIGPGALDALQTVSMRQVDVPVGRVVYTPWLSPSGGFKSDLTIMRLGDEQFRVVTGGAHGMADRKWLADRLPDDGSAQLVDLTSVVVDDRALGAALPRHPRLADARRRLARGVPVRDVQDDRDRARSGSLASRISYVGDLGWELYVPIEQGARLWDLLWEAGEPHGARPVRHRGLRNDRPAREVLPGVRHRARERVHGRRGGHGVGPGQGAGLRREGRARAAPRGGARRDPLHALDRRSHVLVGSRAVSARTRADPHARRRAARRLPRAAART